MIDKSIRSKKYLDKNVGLQGIEREKVVARIYVGKGGASLAKAFQKGGTAGANLGDEIEDLMGVKRGSLKKPFSIVTNFVHPPDDTRTEVGFGCLCGTGEEKLFAFIPHLQKHYDNLAKGLPSPIWLTYWSIEVALPKGDGTVEWWDLRELTVEQIENLDHLITHGMIQSPNGKPANPADTESMTQAIPEAHATCEPPLCSPEPSFNQDAHVTEEASFGDAGAMDDDDFGF
jgi:hypothetical protein